MNWIKGIIIVLISMMGSHIISAQITSYLKAGINFGLFSEDVLIYPTLEDTVFFTKPLITVNYGFGVNFDITKRLRAKQEIFYQVKGQGTPSPDAWSFTNTSTKDKLKFISFQTSIEAEIIQNLRLGIGIQPSIYLSGNDNFKSRKGWKGWTYSGILKINYQILKQVEFGFEYDYDFTQYYCDGCDHRFYTYRLYTAYNFIEK